MNERRPAVSIVLPTQAGNLGYFREAVLSVLDQSLQDFELLVVFDGCSHERAAEALAGLRDSRIRPVLSEKKRGLPRCLNLGARLARAPLIARMDDDDRCLPERLARQVDLMQSDSIDVLGTWSWSIDQQGLRLGDEPEQPDPTLPLSPVRAVFGRLFVHPSVMMRRDWLFDNRYDSSWGYGEDRELWVRAAPHSRYSCVREPLLEYRKSPGVKQSRMKGVRNAYRLIWRYRKRFAAWVPLLLAANAARQAVYWLRIQLRR